MFNRLTNAEIVALIVGGLTLFATGVGAGIGLQYFEQPLGSGVAETITERSTEIVTEVMTEVVTDITSGGDETAASEADDISAGADQSERLKIASSGSGVALLSDEGFDFEAQEVAPPNTDGVDLHVYGPTLQSFVSPIVPVTGQSFPTRARCESLVSSRRSKILDDLPERSYACIRSDQGSLGAIRITGYKEMTDANEVTFDYVMYDE